jgi:hypothetical protein
MPEIFNAAAAAEAGKRQSKETPPSQLEKQVFRLYQDGRLELKGKDQGDQEAEPGLYHELVFTQPFEVSADLAARLTGEKIAVMDIAFNSGRPNDTTEQKAQAFQDTTQAFINALGERLVHWVEHHPHPTWKELQADPRFALYNREQAPACPIVITPETVKAEVDAIVTHGDFDGLMSAAKYIRGGHEPYLGADADAVAADTRIGQISETGLRYEQALKSNLRNDEIKAAIVQELVTGQTSALVDKACADYEKIEAETSRVAATYRQEGIAAVVDTRDTDHLDLTELLMRGQRLSGGVAIAIMRHPITGVETLAVSGSQKNWNLIELFGATGAPGRVQIALDRLDEVIATVNRLGSSGNRGEKNKLNN